MGCQSGLPVPCRLTYLPRATVATISAKAYLGLLAGAAS
jgi:hypothetical protein